MTARYLIDTDWVIHYLNAQPAVVAHPDRHPNDPRNKRLPPLFRQRKQPNKPYAGALQERFRKRSSRMQRSDLPESQLARVIPIKITAPPNATTMEPIMPPPGQTICPSHTSDTQLAASRLAGWPLG